MTRILLLKGFRDMRRSLAQSLALIVITLLGVSSFIALIGAFRDLGTSYTRAYDQLHFADVEISVNSAPQSVLDQVSQVSGVQAVTGRLIVDAGMPTPNSGSNSGGSVVRARLIGIPANQHPAVNDVLVEQGGYLQSSDSASVLVESHFADIYNLAPGDTVSPIVDGKSVPMNVAGVVASPEYLIVSASRQDAIPSARSFAVLFVPIGEVQQISGMSGQINDLAIRYTPGSDQSATLDRIHQLLTPYGIISTTPRADQPSNAALRLDLSGYREIAFLMPGLILLVAAASLYVMFGRQIRAQQIADRPDEGAWLHHSIGRAALSSQCRRNRADRSLVGDRARHPAGACTDVRVRHRARNSTRQNASLFRYLRHRHRPQPRRRPARCLGANPAGGQARARQRHAPEPIVGRHQGSGRVSGAALGVAGLGPHVSA